MSYTLESCTKKKRESQRKQTHESAQKIGTSTNLLQNSMFGLHNYSVKHCETVSSTKGAQRSSSGRHLKNRMHLLEFAKKDASRSEICRVCSRGAFADLLPSVSCKGGRSYHLERTSDKVEHSLVKCISSSPYFQLQMPKTAQGHLSVQT